MVTTKSGSPVAAYPVGFTSASSLLLEIDTLEIRHLYGGVIKKKTDRHFAKKSFASNVKSFANMSIQLGRLEPPALIKQ